jgi:hypothetical protein
MGNQKVVAKSQFLIFRDDHSEEPDSDDWGKSILDLLSLKLNHLSYG